jgi:hypothetical protein
MQLSLPDLSLVRRAENTLGMVWYLSERTIPPVKKRCQLFFSDPLRPVIGTIYGLLAMSLRHIDRANTYIRHV